jgi:group I intron endonuclease
MYVIYKATNTINGKAYIGLTMVGAGRRWKWHVKDGLRRGGPGLKGAIKKYGATVFSIFVLTEAVDLREARAIERGLIAEHGTMVPRGYNLTAGGEGGIASPETRERLRMSHLGKTPSSETRQKMGARRRGIPQPPETRAKIGSSHRGKKRKPLPPEVRAKISEALKGRPKGPFTDEHKRNMAASRVGLTVSAETRAKMSAAQRAAHARRRQAILDGKVPEEFNKSVLDGVLA